MELPGIRSRRKSSQSSSPSEPATNAATISGLSVIPLLEQASSQREVSIIMVDPTGLCGWVNPATASLFGLKSTAELVGRLNLWQHCQVAGDPESHALERAFRGESVEIPELGYTLGELITEGGVDSPALVSAKLLPLLDGNGGLLGIYVFNRPLALPHPGEGPLGDAEEEAELSRCLTVAKRFARKAAHDFNNHIAVMQGFASILHNRLADDEQNCELAEQIEQSGEEALKLTDKLSRFGNNLPGETVSVSLNRTIEAVLENDSQEDSGKWEITTDLQDRMPMVMADPEMLEELCQALRQNAVESMPQGGSLAWTTRHLGTADGLSLDGESNTSTGFIQLRVVDSGSGMDPEILSHIFEPFFTTRPGKGRGLGLTRVYETVRLLQGRIQVESRPEQGTCVEILLPVAVGTPQDDSADEPVGQAKKLLVVDDEDMLREILENFLLQEGYEVVAAADGESAVDICSQPNARVDVVILDMTLPGIDGIETFDRIKAIDKNIKVVIATGDPYRQEVHELMRRGASGMLSKPFRPQHLSEVVRQVLI